MMQDFPIKWYIAFGNDNTVDRSTPLEFSISTIYLDGVSVQCVNGNNVIINYIIIYSISAYMLLLSFSDFYKVFIKYR